LEKNMKLNKFKHLAVAAVLVSAGMNVAHAGYGTAVGDNEKPEAQAQSKQLTNEDVGNFFKGAWNKTKSAAATVTEQTKEFMNKKAEPSSEADVNNQSTELMNKQNEYTPSGKYGSISGNGDILLSPNEHPKAKRKATAEHSEKIKPGEVLLSPNEKVKKVVVAEPSEEVKPGEILLKTWEKTKNVASNVADKGKEAFQAAKEKADHDRAKQAKVQRAEVPNNGPVNVTPDDVVKAKDKVVEGVSSFLNKLRSNPEQDNKNTPKPY
jgi:hypothetical protein